MGYFECGNTQHICELIKKKRPFEFLRDGDGGGAFFDQKNKNQFPTNAQFMTLFWSGFGWHILQSKLTENVSHSAHTWTTTRHDTLSR
jgi:hypothetical protein